MKRLLMTLTFAIATITLCNAQKIEMEKGFGGYKYTQNGTRLTMGQVVAAVQSNPEAYNLIKKAQSKKTTASLMSLVGGALIGWPIGASIGGGDPNWTLAGVGAGFVAVSIPIASGGNKKAKQAVELYNSSLDSASNISFRPEFKIVANANGIGLSVNF
ncbi:hypothetical protein ACFQ1M_00420 [Sungkyunkwania multivorans]|uniref:Uncharacterized protein n=1 Tax=Sungkyunkwania multivorans TaxID=1173618 RepID=A0ABW3CS99_9FLAO